MAINLFTLLLAPVQATETLLPVTIFGDRHDLSGQINANQLLDESDITIAHERSIDQVLQGLPGISFSKTGGFGQPTLPLIRGAGGQGLATLDGIPLLMPMPGLIQFDTLPSEAIQTVAIERGPGSFYRPFQALGGTLRMTTRESEQTGGRFSLEGGSFGILRETLQGAFTGNLGKVTVTANRGDAFDGNRLATAPTNPEREPYHFTQGILRFTSEINSRLLWQGSMLYRNSWVGSDTIGADQNFRAAFLDDYHSFGEAEMWMAQNSLDASITPNWLSHLQLGYTQQATTVGAGALQSSLDNRMYLASLQNRHALIDDAGREIHWDLLWGGEARHEQADSQPTGFSDERTLSSGFFGTEAQHGKISGELGVRVEHYEQYGDQPLFKSAIAWQVTPQLTLRASGGTGYRLPSYTELLSLFFGNPNLIPERSASGELGLEWRPTPQTQIQLSGLLQPLR